jgi:hypothetical protein
VSISYARNLLLCQVPNSYSDVFYLQPLIFNRKSRDWYIASDCIWAEDRIRLPGKISIADQYQQAMEFFIEVLKIETPQLEMHIEAMKIEATNPSLTRILELIECICSYDPSPWELRDLKDCKCLPVNVPKKGQKWMNSSGTFAVADRQEYTRLFADELVMLDFSLEQIHSFEKFLVGLKVHEKFLSVTTQVRTDASETLIELDFTSNIRRKAYAICRYVAFLFILQSVN